MADSPSSSPFVQPLEARRLFAVLDVEGTAGDDTITIENNGAAYIVTVNGQATTHALASVDAVNVFCQDGNDIVVVTGDTRGMYVDGGNGNDRIVGSDGPDTVLGAAGKDQIYGGLGNDRLNGAGGNDKVFGEAGADRLYGGAGNDYIDGGSSGDRLYPQAGLDTCLGQSGNDHFFAIDKTRDELYGGSGVDSCTCDTADLRAAMEEIAVV
jgi:Ca2+-binding RTX toxin-like protein